MAISFSDVTNSIAALSVTGVTIKDIDEIPYSVPDRDCPIMYPEPINFITDFTVDPQAFVSGVSGQYDVSYIMRYTFLYQKAGADRGSLTNYKLFADLVADVWDKMIVSDTLTGAVDVRPAGGVSFGVVLDPAGDTFIGCELLFRVLEFE